jgi:heme exporter protein B
MPVDRRDLEVSRVLRDAALIAGKDLRIELRSRVALNQVLPLAVLLLVLFAFALDPDSGLLVRATPGLFWIATVLCGLLAVQRAFAVEAADSVTDGLRLSALDTGGLFLGKAAAVAVQLIVLEGLLLAGVVLLYDAAPAGWLVLVVTCATATAGIAAAGTLFGVLAAGIRVRETLLPLLLLPVLAPVLLAATRAFEAGFAGRSGEGWPWVGLLAAFALVYIVAGLFGFGALLEEW